MGIGLVSSYGGQASIYYYYVANSRFLIANYTQVFASVIIERAKI